MLSQIFNDKKPKLIHPEYINIPQRVKSIGIGGWGLDILIFIQTASILRMWKIVQDR